MERILTYPEAIREAIDSEMAREPRVLIMGQGVDDPKRILGTTRGLLEAYGKERVFDTPLAEDGMTGIAIGMALAGLRPIHTHIRMDFVLLAMNQLVNMAAKMRYMFGGALSVPLVVRAIVGKSWGQGPQHSQSLYPLFAQVPGLRVVAPSTPHDAKGMMIRAIRANDPVLYMEHRLLYYQRGPVPAEAYEVPFGKARVLSVGTDVTIVGIAQMAVESLRASKHLAEASLRAEVIDPLSISPLDIDTIARSVQKTGHLVIVENAHLPCGLGAEIVALLAERGDLDRIRVRRLGFAFVPCPTTPSLEAPFYPSPHTIAEAAYRLVCPDKPAWRPIRKLPVEEVEFKGPF